MGESKIERNRLDTIQYYQMDLKVVLAILTDKHMFSMTRKNTTEFCSSLNLAKFLEF